MNFLAHFHLARHSQAGIAGALLGDFVKGPLADRFDPALESGIVLHRRIDAYTDEHLRDTDIHQHFPTEWRRYLGIMLDLYFDHLLSRQWSDWEPTELGSFAEHTLEALRSFESEYPPDCLRFYQRLAEYRVLERYGETDMLQGILDRLSTRLPKPNPLATCLGQLQQRHHEIDAVFQTLYPALLDLSALHYEVVE